MKKTLLLLFMVLPLTGCMAAAAGVAGATIGGAILYDKRSVNTMHKDQEAIQTAQYQLDTDPMLRNHSHITVSVFNNVALLVGQADTAEIRDRAYQIVSRVKTVNKIYNEIFINAPISVSRRTQDAWLTTKIRTNMAAKSGLHSNDIKVITENGVVYLMGTVTRKQAALAIDVARRVSGIRKVVKVFEYEK